MALQITHPYVSAIADSGDTSVVQPSDWNDDHAIAGLGTGVETALGVNVGSAGAFVTFNGALGTPSSGTLTNCTGLPLVGGMTGLTANALLYSTDATTLAQDGTNLLYTTSSGPRLQVGSGSTTALGFQIGHGFGSGEATIVPTGLDATQNNTFVLRYQTAGGGMVYIATPTGATGGITLQPLASTNKAVFSATAGAGLALAAGTATTDVSALSATQTWNASGVTFKGWDFTITDTASAAGSLALRIRGGASGTTDLLTVGKTGNLTTGGSIGVAAGSAINGSGSSSITGGGNYRMAGKGYIIPSSDGVWGIYDEATTSFGRLQFGGTTSSFPAIKRSSATLQARLADDSAYATFDGKFAASGAAGANFGPGAVTSITVVDGIITAIS